MLDYLSEAQAVALFGLLGGFALGLAARLGRFCTLGAIEDIAVVWLPWRHRDQVTLRVSA